jgi:hypothetical protein
VEQDARAAYTALGGSGAEGGGVKRVRVYTYTWEFPWWLLLRMEALAFDAVSWDWPSFKSGFIYDWERED